MKNVPTQLSCQFLSSSNGFNECCGEKAPDFDAPLLCDSLFGPFDIQLLGLRH
jgi:hypothetical protein